MINNACKWLLVWILIVGLAPLSHSDILEIIQDNESMAVLQLTKEQKDSLEKIMSIESSQKKLDHENFGFSPDALSEAEMRRCNMIETMFTDILADNQRHLFLLIKKESEIGLDCYSFREKMTFSEKQKLHIDEILKHYETKESEDRKQLRKNAFMLVEAAKKRKSILDQQILDVLNDTQDSIYLKLIHKRDSDTQFNSLKEGLILSERQAAEVKKILKDKETPKKMEPGISKHRKSDRPDRSGDRGSSGGFSQNRMIARILGPEQKELFQQLTGYSEKLNKPSGPSDSQHGRRPRGKIR